MSAIQPVHEPPAIRYTVAVRALCEFAARGGDLDLHYTPAPSAQQGVAGHRKVAARRGASYQSEVPLSGAAHGLLVRGRADGYDGDANRIEEIKTHRGRLATPAGQRALHQAQLRVYGHLMCAQRGLATITLALVYYDIDAQHETVLTEQAEAASLRAFFDRCCERFIGWADAELAHRAARDAYLNALAFPFAGYRAGQHMLARAVFTAQRHGRCLLAQAPTGLGKSVATLFASLKAMPEQAFDKLYYLTARTSGRQPAMEALRVLGPTGAPLRMLELVAREQACEHPERHCSGDSCPLARGFFDRLADARAAAVALGRLDAGAVRAVARAHSICPYYLGQELLRWCDVVVGDVHHYFDGGGVLHAAMVADGWRVGLLVDEAHNLADRSRQMYSASLDQRRLGRLRTGAPRPVARALDRVRRQWRAQVGDDAAPYRQLERPAPALLEALQTFVTVVTDALAEAGPVAGLPGTGSPDGDLREALFDCQRFLQAAERFGEHSLFDVTRTAGTPWLAAMSPAAARPPVGASSLRADASSPIDLVPTRLAPFPADPPPTIGAPQRARQRPATILCLRNVVPAPFTGARIADAAGSVLFSATLTPWPFVRDLLGLPADTRCLDLPTPFDPRRLSVRLAGRLSTRQADRAEAAPRIAALIARQFAQQPGNYLVFASSFAFLAQLSAALAACAPHIERCEQRPAMSEAERRAFVERFTDGSRQIGFAVLGGVFGEAVDLPGRRLIGAFIATLGLPPPDPVNEAIRRRLNGLFGDGYRLAYLYPGLQKVVQAAGRVIRGEHDSGVIHLIDDRFARPEVRALLPAWWNIDGAANALGEPAEPHAAQSPVIAAPATSAAPPPMQSRPIPP